jgi:hypothetical protein
VSPRPGFPAEGLFVSGRLPAEDVRDASDRSDQARDAVLPRRGHRREPVVGIPVHVSRDSLVVELQRVDEGSRQVIVVDTQKLNGPEPERAPVRLKVAGALLAFIGSLTVIGALLDSSGGTGVAIAGNVDAGGVVLIAGLGLLLDARWAWWLTLLVAIGAAGLGIYILDQPGDITHLGAPLVAFYLLLVPSVFIAIALLTPRSLRWLRGSSDRKSERSIVTSAGTDESFR